MVLLIMITDQQLVKAEYIFNDLLPLYVNVNLVYNSVPVTALKAVITAAEGADSDRFVCIRITVIIFVCTIVLGCAFHNRQSFSSFLCNEFLVHCLLQQLGAKFYYSKCCIIHCRPSIIVRYSECCIKYVSATDVSQLIVCLSKGFP
jgi:hypothetical protein